jgi:DNA polymerase-3 subunit epsilon
LIGKPEARPAIGKHVIREGGMVERRLVAIDVETTGLEPGRDRIIEIAAVRFACDAAGAEVDRFAGLVNPGRPIPPGASAVNGIHDHDVVGAPTAAEVLPAFLDWLGAPDGVWLIAHHAGFDAGMLGAELGALGIDHGLEPVIDTLPLSRAKWPGAANHRLGTLAAMLGLETQPTHRALDDARALRALWLALGVRAEEARVRYEVAARAPGAGVAVPRGLEILVIAAGSGQTLSIVYSGGTKGLAPRLVTPRSLVRSGGSGYLRAVCHLDGIEKDFRIDRILEAEAALGLSPGGGSGTFVPSPPGVA